MNDLLTMGKVILVFVVALLIMGLPLIARRYTRNRKAAYNEFLLHRRDKVKLGDMDLEERQ